MLGLHWGYVRVTSGLYWGCIRVISVSGDARREGLHARMLLALNKKIVAERPLTKDIRRLNHGLRR